MKCPKCGSSTWTDKIEVVEVASLIHRCFCGWCSRPDIESRERMVRPLPGPKFMNYAVRK